MSADRSISVILKEMVGNVQDIARSEVRLAKGEIRNEISGLRSAGLLVAIGAFGGLFALSLILLTCVYALSLVLPAWVAALCVAAVVGILGAASIRAGLARFKTADVASIPAARIEEKIEWAKPQIR
jgi:hypothetical protein